MDKKGTSYTVETVEYFRKKYGDKANLFFVTGSDSAESLSLWKDVDRILKLTTFVIASRPGWGLKSPYADRVKLVVMPGMDISSTVIRDRVRRFEPIDYLVPAPVAGYIRKRRLYR
jgi:nicotinate-nucleotide adenylyltransferase